MNPSPRILVVEDDVDIRALNAQVLLGSGYRVETAADGIAGWEALHGNRFDLVVTDHDMPRLSGLELVKQVRAARMTLPVILASATPHSEELLRQPWLQVAVQLLKPFSPCQLLAAVEDVLRAPDPCARAGSETGFPMYTWNPDRRPDKSHALR